jgi:hypothetical protein
MDDRKLKVDVVAKRLTVFPLPLSAEEKVSVGLCGSVAIENPVNSA